MCLIALKLKRKGGFVVDCHKCTKRTNDRKTSKSICGSCREVLKVDLVWKNLGMDRIYLSEANHNKKGQPLKISKANERQEIKEENRSGISMRKLAKKHKVAASTISNIVNEHKLRQK
jgi:Mor family transcriptional regulator